MFNVCVLFCFVGTRKKLMLCYVTVHTVNKTALMFSYDFCSNNLDFKKYIHKLPYV